MSLFSVRFGVRRSAAAALDGYDSPSSCSSSALLRDSSPQRQQLLVRRRGSKRQQFKSRTSQSSSTTTATVLERSISMSGKKLNKMRSIVRHWKKLTQASQSRYLSLAENNNNGSNCAREESEKKRSGSGDSCFFSSSSLSDLECSPSPKSVKHLARSAVADDVPDGCLALFVGRERRRFVIGAHYLEHNLFRGLLERSAAEFGFDQKGGIMIACEVVLFEHLLWLIGTDDPSSRHLQVDELLDFYAY